MPHMPNEQAPAVNDEAVAEVTEAPKKVARTRRSQAAEPWDVEAVLEEVRELSDFDLDSDFVVPAFEESEDAAEESEDRLPDRLREALRESVR